MRRRPKRRMATGGRPTRQSKTAGRVPPKRTPNGRAMSQYPGSRNCDEIGHVELWGECYSIENTTELNLNANQLTGSIPSEIGNLINLTNLNLWYNYMTYYKKLLDNLPRRKTMF